ncbi:Protein kinase superfamily protein [Euphorbia peplus]|nr:Protein kinase superfamily protein [Euphorbia peplus]
MAEKIRVLDRSASFEYMLFEGDPDHLRAVVATPTQMSPWIKAPELKLKHRIGRGVFGDVWLATHHQAADDFDEYHEVAVKMLHPLDEELTQTFVDKFEKLFLKFREIEGVCWFHGISVMNGKIGIAMKFFERSIADQIALSKRGKLELSDVLRYGIDLARGIQELHSIGLLVLNLKPSNFLLSEHDRAVLGDIGIPYLLLGIPLLDSETALRLGTPNYMAPEQWEPEVRGPLSFETDSWGFGCSIVEMLTGVVPWSGKSIEEIYQSVVVNQEKPQIPSGLPPAMESVISGCFEYDLRNRPLMEDILCAFQSTQNTIYSDGGWNGLESKAIAKKSSDGSYTSWYFSKDCLQVGDIVRSIKPVDASKPQTMHVPTATVISLDCDNDKKGFANVQVPGMQNPLRVRETTLERVNFGFAAGDWVCLKEEESSHSPVGILHSVQRDGNVTVGFLGLETLWMGSSSELQKTNAYCVGQFVRLKSNVVNPRFQWPRKGEGEWAVGRITQILPNGCLVVSFPGRLVLGDESNIFLADPAEVERIGFDTCPGVVKKYQHVEDFHWAIRPLAIALGLFTTMKVTVCVGNRVRTKLRKDRRSDDGKGGGNAGWLPTPVANILFKEGAPTATVRISVEGNDAEEWDEEAERQNDDMYGMAQKIQCMAAYRPEPIKKGVELSWQKYSLWRQEQKTRVARLQKQLKAKWEFEQLIEEQLNMFHAHYNRPMVSTSFKDVAEFLMPASAPPHELAALTWLGEWRPSAIMDLVSGLVHSSSVSCSSSIQYSYNTKKIISQFVNEIRIEEAIIESEMDEIQATCIFHLPFSPFNNNRPRTIALSCIQAEFKKIEKVIMKAQQLRFKALEVGIKKILTQTDGAEFLVAFVGIQDLIHKFAAEQKLPHLPAAMPVKSFVYKIQEGMGKRDLCHQNRSSGVAKMSRYY